MTSIYDDPNYAKLKNEVKSKEVSAAVYSTIGSLAVMGAVGLGWAAMASMVAASTPVIAGIAALGVIGMGAGLIGWRKDVDVSYDKQELEARRNAMNLSQALGNAPQLSRQQQAAIAYSEMGRQDGKSWQQAEQERRQQAASQAVDVATQAML